METDDVAGVSGPANLAGKVAVITGGGRGIGRATALRLARAGMRIVVAARTAAEIDETAQSVRAIGAPCISAPTDVADEAQCAALIDRAVSEFGAVDLLVNNAGNARFRPIWETTAADLEYNLAVNLRGLFFCSQAALRVMMPRKRGQIIHIVSSAARKPYANQGAYCAAKAAALALSTNMALELRPYGIRVNAINPGGVDTRLAAEVHPTRDKAGWIRPEEIAETVAYLASLPSNVTVDQVTLRRFLAEPLT
jgi:3-oxoacyl-[acyl-carrier protein] reductase